jgi:hypothetical protein
MKVRMTLEVPDELRRFIAETERNCPTTKDGLASRFAVSKYMQHLVSKLNATQEAFELDRNRIRQEILLAPLTAAEVEDNKAGRELAARTGQVGCGYPRMAAASEGTAGAQPRTGARGVTYFMSEALVSDS